MVNTNIKGNKGNNEHQKNVNDIHKALDKMYALLEFINETHSDYFNQFHNNQNKLVHDNSVIDGNLCIDHLVYGMYANLIFQIKSSGNNPILEKYRKNNDKNFGGNSKKKRNKEIEDICKKMLHLKPDSISLKYAVAKLFLWLNRYDDGGNLF